MEHLTKEISLKEFFKERVIYIYIEGKLFSKSGEKVYEGEFKNGKFHGFGMLYY